MRACRDCHMVTEADTCPACRSVNLSKDFLGYVIVLDAKNSSIAKRMNIETSGTYALKVR